MTEQRENDKSNPRHCPHSMVTDLCGLCIRDRRIAELERQLAEAKNTIEQLYDEMHDMEQSSSWRGG